MKQLLTILLVAASLAVKAQSGNCPTVTVYSPTLVTAGDIITMTANVSGGDPNVTPTYNWMVSNGTISSGQGTSSITIETTGIEAPGSVTGTVDIGGYSRECATSSSSTTSVGPAEKKVTPKAKKQVKVKAKPKKKS